MLTPERLPWYSGPWGSRLSLLSTSAHAVSSHTFHAPGLQVVWLFPLLLHTAVLFAHTVPSACIPLLLPQRKNSAHGSRPSSDVAFSVKPLNATLTEGWSCVAPSALPTPRNRHACHMVIYFQAPVPQRKMPFSLKANVHTHVYTGCESFPNTVFPC